MKALLKERHNKVHNFKLLSLLRLLHCQGWKITREDKEVIHVENKQGGIIEIDIVVSTSKGNICVQICVLNQSDCDQY